MSLPIDRTNKTALDANLVNGNTSDAPVIKSSNDIVYNTIDELNAKVDGLVSSSALSPYPPAFLSRQAIINGNFDVWQRGTTFNTASTGTYTTDRWKVDFNGGSNNAKILQSTVVPNAKSKYSVRIEQMTATGITGENTDFAQLVEEAAFFSGSKVTFSGYIKCDAGRSVQPVIVTDAGSYIGPVINGTAFTLFSFTIQLAATITSLKLMFRVNRDGAAIGAGVNISQAMLSMTGLALPFQPRSAADELALCQRYYEKSYNISDQPGTITSAGSILFQTRTAINASTSGTLYCGKISFKVKKRAVPTVSLFSLNGTINSVRVQNSTNRTGAVPTAVGEDGFTTISIDATSATAIALDNIIDFQYTADCEL